VDSKTEGRTYANFVCRAAGISHPGTLRGGFPPLRPRPTVRRLDAGNVSPFHHDEGNRPAPLDPCPTVRRLDARRGFRALHHGGRLRPLRPLYGAFPMSAVATASWYHCSVKPVSRSAGRSVVAAAAYRMGECLHDERYATVHDYTRRRGVECAFMVAPADAPEWAHNPERLWNEAERAEARINSRVAREVELALPAFLTPAQRQRIAEQFATALVERYGVAVTVAIHEPGRGDERNYHAHILFTTRTMTPDGLGKKTRILDDRKTGPQEVTKLRELAADIINRELAAVNSDIRVDHRSFKDRGIEREPTTHLGPAVSEMERRGEQTERGEMNRQAAEVNHEAAQNESLLAERDTLDKAIDAERERISSPPADPEDALERIREAAEPFREAIETRGAVPNIESDGLTWWQRLGMGLAEKARNFAIALAQKARYFWQSREQERSQEPEPERDHDDRGIDL
jgi:hypothetical protein